MWEAPATRYTADELAALEGPQPAPEFGVTPPGQRAAAAQPPQPGAPAGGRGGQGGERSQRLPAGRGRARRHLHGPARPRDLHGRRHPHQRSRDDAARRRHRRGAVRPHRADRWRRRSRSRSRPTSGTPTIRSRRSTTSSGEIPGTDKADEVVLIGAHFDTWHAGTGAADDGNGSAAMMEAMRILKATGVKLRRTVRIGLWGAEEQGLIGSYEYVSVHYANRPSRRAALPARAAGRARGCRGRRVRRAAGAARAEAGAREVLGLLQHRQRHRCAARHLHAGKRGRRPDLPPVDRAVPQPRHDHRHHPQHGRDRPPVVRSGRPAGRSSSSRTRSSTTRSLTTRTWTRTNACSRATTCRWRPSSRASRTWRRTATS